MPSWLFWLLLLIILGLGTLILVRDKGIREAVIKIFTRVKEKIRVSRLKAKIGKEEEKKQDLLKELGKIAWEKSDRIEGMETQWAEVGKLREQKDRLEKEINKLNEQLEKNKKDWEEYEAGQKNRVTELEGKKEPIEKEFTQVKKDLQEIDKEIEEREKRLEKLDKKTAGHEKKKQEIEKDEDLSNIEKNEQTMEIDGELKQFEAERELLKKEIHQFKSRDPQKRGLAANLEKQLKEYEDSIQKLKEEKKVREKEKNDIIAGIRSDRNQAVGQKTQLDKNLDGQYEEIGTKVNKQRPAQGDLEEVYQRIDQVNRTIRDFEAEIDKEE